MLRKNYKKFIRLSLRLHSFFHLIEFFSAIYETAYFTAFIAFFAMTLELMASFLIPKEHVHFKPFKTEVHEECDNK